MKVSCWSQMHRTGALWGVLYLAFFSGCLSPDRADKLGQIIRLEIAKTQELSLVEIKDEL